MSFINTPVVQNLCLKTTLLSLPLREMRAQMDATNKTLLEALIKFHTRVSQNVIGKPVHQLKFRDLLNPSTTKNPYILCQTGITGKMEKPNVMHPLVMYLTLCKCMDWIHAVRGNNIVHAPLQFSHLHAEYFHFDRNWSHLHSLKDLIKSLRISLKSSAFGSNDINFDKDKAEVAVSSTIAYGIVRLHATKESTRPLNNFLTAALQLNLFKRGGNSIDSDVPDSLFSSTLRQHESWKQYSSLDLGKRDKLYGPLSAAVLIDPVYLLIPVRIAANSPCLEEFVVVCKTLGTERPSAIEEFNHQLLTILLRLADGDITPEQLAGELLSVLESPEAEMIVAKEELYEWYKPTGPTIRYNGRLDTASPKIWKAYLHVEEEEEDKDEEDKEEEDKDEEDKDEDEDEEDKDEDENDANRQTFPSQEPSSSKAPAQPAPDDISMPPAGTLKRKQGEVTPLEDLPDATPEDDPNPRKRQKGAEPTGTAAKSTAKQTGKPSKTKSRTAPPPARTPTPPPARTPTPPPARTHTPPPARTPTPPPARMGPPGLTTPPPESPQTSTQHRCVRPAQAASSSGAVPNARPTKKDLTNLLLLRPINDYAHFDGNGRNPHFRGEPIEIVDGDGHAELRAPSFSNLEMKTFWNSLAPHITSSQVDGSHELIFSAISQELFLGLTPYKKENTLSKCVVLCTTSYRGMTVEEALKHSGPMTTPRVVHDLSLPVGDNYNNRQVLITFQEFLAIAQNPDPKKRRALNILDIPISITESYIGFDLAQVAWNATCHFAFLQVIPWPGHHFRWNLAASSGAEHGWHMDAEGLATWVRVLTGEKVWTVVIDRRQILPSTFILEGSPIETFGSSLPKGYAAASVRLTAGTIFCMPPGMTHCVTTTDTAVCEGGHMYTWATMQQTLWALIHLRIRDQSTNTEHAVWSEALVRIVTFFHYEHILGNDPQNPHLPSFEQPSDWQNLCALFVIMELLNVLSGETYRAAKGKASRATDQDRKVDCNALSDAQRMMFIMGRGLATHSVNSLVDQKTKRSFRVDLFVPMMAWTIFYLREAFELGTRNKCDLFWSSAADRDHFNTQLDNVLNRHSDVQAMYARCKSEPFDWRNADMNREYDIAPNGYLLEGNNPLKIEDEDAFALGVTMCDLIWLAQVQIP